MTLRSSFSQHNMFHKCPRCWYYNYVLKVPQVSDLTYAHAGNVLHNTLQKYYDGKLRNKNEIKDYFNIQWGLKKLDDTFLRHKKDEYYLMVVNGVNLNKVLTSTEMKIFYPDAVAYLDGVNTEGDEILDWKSSTRRPDNEIEYTMQLKFYCWMYYRKFNRVPKKATVYYLKYNGSKQELSFEPTMDDVNEAKEWFEKIYQQMEEIKVSGEIPNRVSEHNPWCAFENICNAYDTGAIKFSLILQRNTIYIDGPINELLHKGLIHNFSYELKDSYWIKKNNPNANTTINFWNHSKRTLPIGFLQELKGVLVRYIEHLQSKGNEVSLELEVIDKRTFDETKVEMPDKFLNGIILRDYQDAAVEKFLSNKIGILEIGTGGGKTEIAIECIRRLGMKTLFIVDKIELMRQTKERLEKALGITIGQIGQGENDIQDVTVATVQTITKHIGKYSNYLQSIRFCIFDETHKVAAKSYLQIGNFLANSEYRLGISGTAFRDDGNDMMINATVGKKIYDLSSKVLIREGWLVKPQIKFIKKYMDKELIKSVEQNSKDGLINETPNYSNYYGNFISKNSVRNEIIRKIVEDNKSKKILILVKLIEHGELLEDTIPASHYLHGGTSKKERERMFNDFVNDDTNVLISTISIFAEGIDIPSLDMVINAAANKGDVKTIQVLGRVLRKMEGKNNAQYIDFIDETKFFRMASLARKRALHREGHEVEVVEYEQAKK